MPRVLDPSSLSRGGGLAASRSVEATSFVNPTQGLDTTIAHIVDPSRAHMARAIGVEDTAGNFTSDHVEGALAELAAGHGDTNQNGVFSGCTPPAVGSGGGTGLVTFPTPSLVLINGTERDLSGATHNLADGPGWLFVNGTGALTSVLGAAPSITSPENVLIAHVTVAAGTVSASVDARWFVRNIERKLPFTVRASGTVADQNSEAAFETIDAALLYLANFGGGVIRNSTLVIKGPLTIGSSLVIPTNNVTLQGEGGCVLTTSAALTPMIDVSSRSGIRIRDITFTCANAASSAIGAPSGGVISDVVIERCIFNGASDWGIAINFDLAGPQTKVTVRDCTITAATSGVQIREPVNCRIEDTLITEVGGAGTIGFQMGRVGGAVGAAADSIARGVRTVGFSTGGFLRGVRLQSATCSLVNSDTGILVSANSADVGISDCTVLLDATTGLVGVDLAGGTGIRLSGGRISNQRAGGGYGGGEIPIGVHVANGVNYVSIIGTHIDSFLNTVGSHGHGILTDASSTDLVVDGCTVMTAFQGITANSGTNVLISGTSVRGTDIGMVIAGTGNTITGCNVVSSSTRGTTGIQVDGPDTTISSCTIIGLWASGTPVGISTSTGTLKVSNCILRGWSDGGAAGSGMALVAGAGQVTVTGTTFVACWNGFYSPSGVGASEVTISGCSFRSTAQYAVFLDNSDQVHIDGCTAINGDTSAAFYVANSTDVEIIGCKVFGNSTTVTGIHLVGSDTGPTRMRRFLVSSNTIMAVTGDGILLDGYVQNGVVSGNHVDCFLTGAPSDPTALACIRLVSAATNLIKHVEVTGNTCWRAQNGIVITGVSASVFASDISVNGNTIHHCAVGSGGATTCSGVAATFVQNLTVAGNSISSIGKLINDSDVSASPTAGANAYPYGIQVLNSTQMQIGNNAVTDCIANGAGTVTGISVKVVGAGVVMAVRGVSIVGNRVTTADAVTPMDTGILVAAGDVGAGFASTVLGLAVSGNTVRRVDTGIIVSSGGGCSMQQVVVASNAVSSVTGGSGFGVSIAAVTAGVLTPGILREVEVTGNNVGDAGNIGVYVAAGDGCALTTFSMHDNTIADTGSYGIRVEGGILAAPADFRNLDFVGNTIAGAASDGISLIATDFGLVNISIMGNSVFGANGTSAAGKGIFMQAQALAVPQANASRITVSGNKIHAATLQGIHLDIDGTLQQAVFSGNVVEVDGIFGVLTLTLDSPADVLAQAYSGEIVMSDNSFTGGGVWVTVDHGQKLRNFTFSDNVSQGSLFGFLLTMSNGTVGPDEAVTGLSIQGNTFDAIAGQAIRLLLGDLVTAIDTCNGISVTGNKLRNCRTAGVDNAGVYVRCFCLLQNLTVSGNSFASVGTLDSIASGNIWVQLGTSAGAAADNIVVSDNSFMSCSGVGILVEDQDTGPAAWTVINLKVEGNSIKTQVNDAIRLDLTDFTVANCISVSGNNIVDISSPGATSDTGIVVLGPTSVATNQLSICQNVLRSTGDEATGAILVTLLGDANGLVIDGNSVANDGATSASILVTMNNPGAGTNTWSGGSVSGNTIASPAARGVWLQSTGSGGAAGIKGVTVSKNQVSGSVGDGVFVQGLAGATNATLSNLTLSNNVVDGSGGYGIHVDGYSLADITVSGNAVRGSTQDGLNLSSISGMGGTDTDMNSVSITGNDIRNSGRDAILVQGAQDIIGLVISGNTSSISARYGIYVTAQSGVRHLYSININGNSIQDWGTDDAASYGVYLQADDAKSVAIGANTLQSTVDDVYGFYLLLTGAVRGFNLQNNTLVLTGDTTQSLLFDAGALDGDQKNMSITGNSFAGAVAGVNFSGAQFAPANSICAMNNEKTAGGAGNWSVFAATPVPWAATCTVTPNQD